MFGYIGESMGESLVERPTPEKRMDESVKSSAGMEVSVSFGRFENDVLSWEKWSSFSPNKYLEEVGNLSTPGSVAQKKAYFEAHYKKIAARKAEELEQAKSMVLATTSSLDDSSNDDCMESSTGIDAGIGLSIGERSVKDAAQVECAAPLADSDSDKGTQQESSETVFVEGVSCFVEEAKDELIGNEVALESNMAVGAAPVEVETRRENSRQTKEIPPEKKHGAKQASPKLNARGVAQKVTSTKRVTNSSGIRKKAVPPAIRPLPASTPKHSKMASVSTPMSASQSLTKKVNGSPVTGSKRAVPTSLHMSLSLGPASYSPAQSMNRKSLIMETDGDKKIIRQTFKTFQNRANASSIDKSSTAKQVKSTALEPKISTHLSRKKGNEGKHDAVKVSAQRNQPGVRSSPLHTGSSRSSAVDKKNTASVSSSISLRSDERAKKRKEFLKKLEAKSIARAAENTQHSAKTKEEKESVIEKLRKSLNFKAKPLPPFYKVQTKPHVEKEAPDRRQSSTNAFRLKNALTTDPIIRSLNGA